MSIRFGAIQTIVAGITAYTQSSSMRRAAVFSLWKSYIKTGGALNPRSIIGDCTESYGLSCFQAHPAERKYEMNP